MKDLSIDIETLGTLVDSQILSIGDAIWQGLYISEACHRLGLLNE